MPNERISMSKLKQLIGLQSSNLSVRAMGRALGLSVGAVSKYLRAVRACDIGAGEAETLSELELERRVFWGVLGPKLGPPGAPGRARLHPGGKRPPPRAVPLLWGGNRGRLCAAPY